MAVDINLDAAKSVFFTEARQLLADMETHVLQLEQDPQNLDVLNAAFRAAHTIKGSAGVFGFGAITHFVHDLETVLDRVRNQELAFSAEMSTLVLECRDHTSALVDFIESEGEDAELSADLHTRQSDLTRRLKLYLQDLEEPVQATSAASDAPAQEGAQQWRIRLRLCESTFRDGFDPRPIFNYLDTLGRIETLVPVLDAMPAFDKADAENCYLGFDLTYRSESPRQDILDAFEFISAPSTVEVDALGAVQADAPEAGLSVAQANALIEKATEKTAAKVAAKVVDTARNTSKGNPTAQSAFIRVPADKLDALINLVGELVIANAGTVERARQSHDTAMLESTSAVASLIEEIRDGALGLRMVQIGETFHRFHRVVRDLSMGLGKQIALNISGEDTELDKSVVERIGDPLMHLVRNALDHGLETSEERAIAGKNPVGQISLNAYHDSGHIVIEVTDDGKGLPREKILNKAIEKGLVSAEATLSDAEVNQLIFLPGFSTAEKITDISGRGVGMDVVKKNIEALRGSVQVRSKPGAGTTFEIRLPLTLAIIDGFQIGVGNAQYVIPLGFVRECLELPSSSLNDDRMDASFDLRGEFLPFVRLRSIFGVTGPRPKRENIIVVSFGGMRAGIVTDQLHGESQTVIKPLGSLFESNKAISGATILGSGDVALIIDVPKLINEVAARSAAAFEHKDASCTHKTY